MVFIYLIRRLIYKSNLAGSFSKALFISSKNNLPRSSSVAPLTVRLITFGPVAAMPCTRLTAGLVAGTVPIRMSRISAPAAGEC